MSAISTDTLSMTFINPLSGQTAGNIVVSADQTTGIGNYTEVAFKKDYFEPSNGLTFIIADKDTSSLSSFIQRGYQVQVKINGNYQMIGYVFNYHFRVNRHGGTEIEVHCKDLLEYMAQGSIPPNMGTGTGTFHFNNATDINTALEVICHNFQLVTGQPITINIENNEDLTFASGFKTGVRRKMNPTFSKARSKSISTALAHLAQPNRGGESYLDYMVRLVKHIGGNVKMSNYIPNVIFVKPPTYDRVPAPGTTEQSPFQLVHYLTSPNSQKNNVHSVEYYFNGDHQPSVVIMEANTNNNATNYQAAVKGIAYNELTAYAPPTSGSGEIPQILPAVQTVVNEATSGANGVGWFLAPPNVQLYNFRSQFPIDTFTNVALPHYKVDPNAHTTGVNGEGCYAASKYLAEQQDKCFEAVFHVDGWSYVEPVSSNQYIWQPDMMVSITEESFTPGFPKTFNLWIKSVEFTKSRHGGTETKIVCTLPYTHNFEITE
jgi:hypothetical protein